MLWHACGFALASKGARHPRPSGIAQTQKHPAHGAIHRTVPYPLQKLPASLIASLSTSTFSGKHGSAPLPGEGKNSDLGPIILVIHWAAHASKVNSKVVCDDTRYRAPSQRCDPSQRCEERLAPKAENGQKRLSMGVLPKCQRLQILPWATCWIRWNGSRRPCSA